ncbi:MAG: hypothetical protein J5808_04695 [Paludibacteraceae bacterium]|nr:hypothetical protein [Paludibacteraceae bacterium]
MSSKLPKIVLYVLIAVTVIVAALFFLGGYVDENAEYLEPKFTSTLLNLMYAFVAIAGVLVLVDVVLGFVRRVKSNPKAALKSLIGPALLVVLLLVTFLISNGGHVNVLGLDYTPSQTELRLVDMQLYSVYVLLCISLVLMLVGGFAKKIK